MPKKKQDWIFYCWIIIRILHLLSRIPTLLSLNNISLHFLTNFFSLVFSYHFLTLLCPLISHTTFSLFLLITLSLQSLFQLSLSSINFNFSLLSLSTFFPYSLHFLSNFSLYPPSVLSPTTFIHFFTPLSYYNFFIHFSLHFLALPTFITFSLHFRFSFFTLLSPPTLCPHFHIVIYFYFLFSCYVFTLLPLFTILLNSPYFHPLLSHITFFTTISIYFLASLSTLCQLPTLSPSTTKRLIFKADKFYL